MKHRDYDKLKEGAFWLYQVMQQNLAIPVLGPEEPVISRIRNEYIRTIMIKIPQNHSLQVTKKTIQKMLNSFAFPSSSEGNIKKDFQTFPATV